MKKICKNYIIDTNKILNSDIQNIIVKEVSRDEQGIRVEPVNKKLKKKYGTLSYYFKIDELKEVVL